jgi:hypothetical protein
MYSPQQLFDGEETTSEPMSSLPLPFLLPFFLFTIFLFCIFLLSFVLLLLRLLSALVALRRRKGKLLKSAISRTSVIFSWFL